MEMGIGPRLTAEIYGERIVEQFRGVRVDDVTSLQFPWLWGGYQRRLGLPVLVFDLRPLSDAGCPRRAYHTMPDTERVRP
jgi:hypothetical protein